MGGRKWIPAASKAQYKRWYVEQQLGSREIGSILGVSNDKVLKDLRRLNIETRPQIRYPNLRRSFFNEIDSSDKAYVLGLIWTDGSVSTRTGQLRIRLKDAWSERQLLERVRTVLGGGDIYDIAPTAVSPNGAVGFRVSSREIVRGLRTWGIVPNKSRLAPSAIEPPQEFLRDFVRGLIDGDGSLKWIKGQYPRLQFTNANESLVRLTRLYFRQLARETPKMQTKRSADGRLDYHWLYLSSRDSVLVAMALYDCDPGDLYLERKASRAAEFARWKENKVRGRLTRGETIRRRLCSAGGNGSRTCLVIDKPTLAHLQLDAGSLVAATALASEIRICPTSNVAGATELIQLGCSVGIRFERDQLERARIAPGALLELSLKANTLTVVPVND